jgi:acyl dehydratase
MDFTRFIDLSGPPFDFPVELGKQREFAAALHAFHPEFHDGPTPLMFPTLPIIAGYIWGYMLEEPRGTPLEALQMADAMSLDGEQEFIFHGPKLRAGDRLTAQTSVADIWQKQGRRGGKLTFYKMRCDFRDAATGALRLELFSTSVVPEDVPEETPASTRSNGGAYLPYREERRQFMDLPRRSPASLQVGDTPGPVCMPPHTLTDCVRYQITTGSYGAAHHDEQAARAAGFPTWFGVGMYHAGLLCTYATGWLGVEPLVRFKARFLDVTWPGDVLTYSGEVESLEAEGDRPFARLALRAVRPDGTVVTRAWADFATNSAS